MIPVFRSCQKEGDAKQADYYPSTSEKGEPLVLRPNDGEAENFALMGVDEIVERIVREEFKPNCAIVLVDFFIRWAITRLWLVSAIKD